MRGRRSIWRRSSKRSGRGRGRRVAGAIDGYDYNAAKAWVSAESVGGTNVILEVFRLDGAQVDIRSGPVDYFAGWVSTGFAEWFWQAEGILLFRVTTTGAVPLLVDFAWVGVVE